MMQVILPRSWREEFALAASLKREEILQREKMAQFMARQRQITIEKQIEEKRREQEYAALEAAFLPPQRIVEYRAQLDRYDTSTVTALMDNQQATDFVREKINALLGSAHTLEDGRRMFKTIDGQQVFDEHGKELNRDIIDPASIGDEKPKWEMFKAVVDERERLGKERDQLLEYQGKLDLARERLDKGEITERELKEMDAGLSAKMPDAVRQKLGIEKQATDVAPESAPRAPAMPDDMDSLMRRTGLGPSAPTNG